MASPAVEDEDDADVDEVERETEEEEEEEEEEEVVKEEGLEASAAFVAVDMGAVGDRATLSVGLLLMSVTETNDKRVAPTGWAGRGFDKARVKDTAAMSSG
jgi:hypothetical protein